MDLSVDTLRLITHTKNSEVHESTTVEDIGRVIRRAVMAMLQSREHMDHISFIPELLSNTQLSRKKDREYLAAEYDKALDAVTRRIPSLKDEMWMDIPMYELAANELRAPLQLILVLQQMKRRLNGEAMDESVLRRDLGITIYEREQSHFAPRPILVSIDTLLEDNAINDEPIGQSINSILIQGRSAICQELRLDDSRTLGQADHKRLNETIRSIRANAKQLFTSLGKRRKHLEHIDHPSPCLEFESKAIQELYLIPKYRRDHPREMFSIKDDALSICREMHYALSLFTQGIRDTKGRVPKGALV